jgi:hypothetical protein
MAKGAVGKFVDDDAIDGDATNSAPIDSDSGVHESSSEPDTISGFESFDPATGSTTRGSSVGSSGTGKRGRPKGSKNGVKTGGTSKKSDLSGLEGILLSVHFFLAKGLEVSELELAEDEAKQLASAMTRVTECYDTKFNPKVMAWTNLSLMLGSIYGPRFWAIKNRKDAEAAKPAGALGGKIVDIRAESGGAAERGTAERGREPQTPADLFGLGYNAIVPDAL